MNLAAVQQERPSDWQGLRLKSSPPWTACKKARVQLAGRDLESSEANAPRKAAPAKTRIEADLAGLTSLFGKPQRKSRTDEEDSDSDEEENESEEKAFLKPGATAKGSRQRSSRAPKHQDLDLKAEVIKALAGGQSANELMPLMMMAMLADNKSKKSKRRKERETDANLLGSSSSAESEDESHVANRGMKAVATLHRLHARIQKKPLKVCAIFEKEAREELGVVQGQSWTLRDFVKKQP